MRDLSGITWASGMLTTLVVEAMSERLEPTSAAEIAEVLYDAGLRFGYCPTREIGIDELRRGCVVVMGRSPALRCVSENPKRYELATRRPDMELAGDRAMAGAGIL